MKRGKMIRKLCYISILFALLISGIFLWKIYVDRRNCICSQLTDEMQQFEIDRKLMDIYDIADRSGTFVWVVTPCKHDESLRLMIFPDEGFYYGCKSKISEQNDTE